MDSKKRPASEEVEDDISRKKGKFEPESIGPVESEKPQKRPFNPLPETHTPPRPAFHLFVFGNGDSGQFGLGPDVSGEFMRPRIHTWTETAMQEGKLGGEGCGLARVCCGGMHTLALDESGKVWSWGVNDEGSLGRITDGVTDPMDPSKTLDSEELEWFPKTVALPSEDGFRAINIISGDSVSVALSNDGQLRVWGSFRASDGPLGFDGKPGSPKIQHTPMVLPILANMKFVQISCGTDHVLGLTTQGHVWVWGNGQNGQLGRKIIERRKINGLSPERLALRRIKLIGTGSYHSFAVDAKGTVWAWGLNTFNQTGVEPEEEVDQSVIWEPTELKALHPKALGMGRKVVQISGGEFHTLFRISDGSVYACGRCDDGQLGFGHDHPSMVQKRNDEERMNKDRADELEKKRSKEEKKRRKSEQSAASQGAESKPPVPAPNGPAPIVIESIAKPALVDFPCGDKIVDISASARHNLAVSSDGELYSWGTGGTCQLGLGKDEKTQQGVEQSPSPTLVTSKQLEGWKVRAASAGGQHCAILAQRD